MYHLVKDHYLSISTDLTKVPPLEQERMFEVYMLRAKAGLVLERDQSSCTRFLMKAFSLRMNYVTDYLLHGKMGISWYSAMI